MTNTARQSSSFKSIPSAILPLQTPNMMAPLDVLATF